MNNQYNNGFYQNQPSFNSNTTVNNNNNQINANNPAGFTYVISNNQQPVMKKGNPLKLFFIGIFIGFIVLGVGYFAITFINGNNFYFSDTGYNDSGEYEISYMEGDYTTAIEHNHVYNNVKISSENEAKKLIVNDSVRQKKTCKREVINIENEIISKYKITAVNLCEMDPEFASELKKLIKEIYDNYPSVRGNLTNITLKNANANEASTIALFSPTFKFASNSNTYPYVMKMQILLNSRYFLDQDYLESSVYSASVSGWFPRNTTRYSPVAHEFGHYLSFIALMKNYNTKSLLMVKNSSFLQTYNEIINDFNYDKYSQELLNEAYSLYVNETKSKKSFDEFRSDISKYAMSKTNDGRYIYDETIAEAFHDVYLNGNNACISSRYIVRVLKNKLSK